MIDDFASISGDVVVISEDFSSTSGVVVVTCGDDFASISGVSVVADTFSSLSGAVVVVVVTAEESRSFSDVGAVVVVGNVVAVSDDSWPPLFDVDVSLSELLK